VIAVLCLLVIRFHLEIARSILTNSEEEELMRFANAEDKQVRAEIEAANEKFVAALNGGDATGIAALYTG
jgi:hypothetical protein